jgi:capsule polysaccharide export protein KpsE/RkpR
MTAKEQQNLILSRLRDLDWELTQLNKKLDQVTSVLNKWEFAIKQLEDNS